MGRLCIPSLVLLAGCGSYWDLRKGEELPIGCASRLNYFPDEDGDGWGAQDSPPEEACAQDAPSGKASNALDCDDADAGLTGRAGAICPSQMASQYGGSPCVVGTQQGDSELVATCLDGSPTVPFGQAIQDCTLWAGWETPEAVAAGTVGHRGLAALEDDIEFGRVTTWLRDNLVPNTGGFAVWIDLQWDGTVDSGQWVFRAADGSTINPTWIVPCGGADPMPGDLWPDLLVGGPTDTGAAAVGGRQTVEDELDKVRLALIWDGAGWCRGIPEEAGGEYGPRSAHVLCERPRPTLADYESYPEDGEG